MSGVVDPARGAAPPASSPSRPTASVGVDDDRPPAAAHGPAAEHGPAGVGRPLGAPAPAVVDGVTCPEGAVPAVNLTSARFSPQLVGGTDFAPGSYGITLSGVVANESTAPVVVRSLTLTVGGAPWTADVSPVGTVAAQTSTPITVRGTYRSRGPARVAIEAHLDWQWQEPALRPCGEKGLVEDD